MKTQRPNVYDYLKAIALITMIIDHVGFLLYPDVEILRVIGRIAFPLFLFLVGYNHSYRMRPSLWMWGILLQIGMWVASYAGYIDMRYANILLAIGVTRIILGWVQRQDNIYLELILMAGALFFASASAQRVDFGSLSIVFGLLGYRVRKRGWSWKSALSIVIIMCTYTLFTQQWFDFSETYFIVRGVLGVILAGLMMWMGRSNTSLISRSKQWDNILLRCSKHCLHLYVVQVIVIGLLYVVV